eukprot:Nk52_evm45s164 gene=Nk52_evmTU45s164
MVCASEGSFAGMEILEETDIERVLEASTYNYEDSGCKASMKAIALARLFRNRTAAGGRDICESDLGKCKKFIRLNILNKDKDMVLIAVEALGLLLLIVPDEWEEFMETYSIVNNLMKIIDSSKGEEDINLLCCCLETLLHAIPVKEQAKVVKENISVLLSLQENEDIDDTVRVRVHTIIARIHCLTAGTSNRKTFKSEDLKVMGESILNNLAMFLESPSLLKVNVVYWSMEALLYLSVDPECKEMITFSKEYINTLRSLIPGNLKKRGNLSVSEKSGEVLKALDKNSAWRFNICTILLNSLNAGDKDKSSEQSELEKIRKFAGDTVSQPNPKDAEEFVEKRVEAWVDNGIIEMLYRLCETESVNVRHVCSLCMVKITTILKKSRGKIAQQGGCGLLCDLASRKNTDEGILKASQALAHLAISLDPELAFTGNLLMNSIRPLLKLLDGHHELYQFEGLMALTNFAAVSEEARSTIAKENGMEKFISLQLNNNYMVQRAATEALSNMLQSQECYNMFASKDGALKSKLKLWLFFSGSDDVATSSAASGGMAKLTESAFACQQLLKEEKLVSILKDLVLSDDEGLRLRGVCCLKNFIMCGNEVAEKVLDNGALEMLTVVEKHSNDPAIKQPKLICPEVCEKINCIAYEDKECKKSVSAAHSHNDSVVYFKHNDVNAYIYWIGEAIFFEFQPRVPLYKFASGGSACLTKMILNNSGLFKSYELMFPFRISSQVYLNKVQDLWKT